MVQIIIAKIGWSNDCLISLCEGAFGKIKEFAYTIEFLNEPINHTEKKTKYTNDFHTPFQIYTHIYSHRRDRWRNKKKSLKLFVNYDICEILPLSAIVIKFLSNSRTFEMIMRLLIPDSTPPCVH